MPRLEREELTLRIVEIQQILEETRSEDLREVLVEALAVCTTRLAELDELLGIEPT
jgi:hypothetical protein